MRVTPNITAPSAARSLADAGNRQQRALERVSAGQRGPRPTGDAAEVTAVDAAHADASANLQAQRRAQEGISLVQTADGALADVHAALVRMRELAVRADGESSLIDRAASQAELAALQDDVRRIGERTTFSGQPVFADYSAADDHLVLHLGAHGTEPLTALSQNLSLDSAHGGVLAQALRVELMPGGTRPVLDVLDATINDVAAVRRGLRDVQDRLERAVLAPATDASEAVSVEELAALVTEQVQDGPGTAQAAQAERASTVLRRHLEG
jgi:flagellin